MGIKVIKKKHLYLKTFSPEFLFYSDFIAFPNFWLNFPNSLLISPYSHLLTFMHTNIYTLPKQICLTPHCYIYTDFADTHTHRVIPTHTLTLIHLPLHIYIYIYIYIKLFIWPYSLLYTYALVYLSAPKSREACSVTYCLLLVNYTQDNYKRLHRSRKIVFALSRGYWTLNILL